MRTEAASPSPAPACDEPWWRATWPLGWKAVGWLVVALVVVVGVFSVVGQLYIDTVAPNPITDVDEAVAESFVDVRTPGWNTTAEWGSLLSDTLTKVVVSALVALGTILAWRRWREALLVVLTLVFEATAFITITFLVDRPRPDVPRLLDSPVNSSFPSGHVAAATVYLAFAIIVFWHTRSVWVRGLVIVLIGSVPVVVGLARMYQGMHYLSDVVAGMLLGLMAAFICARVLGPPSRSRATPVVGSEYDAGSPVGRARSPAPDLSAEVIPGPGSSQTQREVAR